MPKIERSDATARPPSSPRGVRSVRRPRTSTAAVGAVCAALLVSGCSSPDSPEAAEKDPSGLLTALAHAAPGSETAGTIAFTNSAEFRKLYEDDPKWFGFTDPLGSPVLNPPYQAPGDHGFDPADVDLSLLLGYRTGLLLGSFDAERTVSELKADGYRQRERDGRTVLVAPDEERPGPDLFLEVSDREIAYGRRAEDLDRVDADREGSLAEDPEYRWLSDCLGKVYRADITHRGDGETVSLVAIGQVAGAPGGTSGVICAPLEDERTAERAAEALEEVVEEEADRYRGSEVTVVRGDRPGVKVTVPDRPEHRRAGRLLTADLKLLMALDAL
ncbi:hypothetical protein [Streptomyces macrosporus]|uniref:Lipoprotein n=1 Tax=Streptomyces macrosporus TaxID=44032 RepID=A0ABN3J9I5_9ACTN